MVIGDGEVGARLRPVSAVWVYGFIAPHYVLSGFRRGRLGSIILTATSVTTPEMAN